VLDGQQFQKFAGSSAEMNNCTPSHITLKEKKTCKPYSLLEATMVIATLKNKPWCSTMAVALSSHWSFFQFPGHQTLITASARRHTRLQARHNAFTTIPTSKQARRFTSAILRDTRERSYHSGMHGQSAERRETARETAQQAVMAAASSAARQGTG